MTSSITIIAGGFSASLLDLRKLPGTVIAVNDSALYAPRVDLVCSMDRLWAENRVEKVKRMGVPVWLRRSTLKNIGDFPTLTRFENDHTSTTLSDEPGRLNGTHSGFCALNLAYSLKPLRLFLVGFDMQRGPRDESHWYPDYPWNPKASGSGKLQQWGHQFDTAASQFRRAGTSVFVAGPPLGGWMTISRADLEKAAAHDEQS